MKLHELTKYTTVQLRLPKEETYHVIHEGIFLRHDNNRYMEIEKNYGDAGSFLMHVDYYMLEIFAEINGEWVYVEQS